MKVLKCGDEVYTLKIGLKGLMILAELSINNVKDDLALVLSCALLDNQPIKNSSQIKSLIDEVGEDKLLLLLEDLYKPITKEKLDDLYIRGVGEMGISPNIFFTMTEEELELAYEGYLRRKELEANMTMLALFKQANNDNSTIRLIDEKKYVVGSPAERELVFSTLGLSEVV